MAIFLDRIREPQRGHKQTWANYVVGNGNKHAVIRMQEWMTEKKKYNGLFIYGERGTGKTHLAKAVCHYMLEHGISVRMRNPNDFTEELLGWLRIGVDLEKFYQNYVELAEVFIMDDIQAFEKIPQTEECCKELIRRLLKAEKKVLLIARSRKVLLDWPGSLFLKKIRLKAPDKNMKKEILKKYARADK